MGPKPNPPRSLLKLGVPAPRTQPFIGKINAVAQLVQLRGTKANFEKRVFGFEQQSGEPAIRDRGCVKRPTSKRSDHLLHLLPLHKSNTATALIAKFVS